MTLASPTAGSAKRKTALSFRRYVDDTVLLLSNRSVVRSEVDSFISVNVASEYCPNNSLIFNKSKKKKTNFGSKGGDVPDLSQLSAKQCTKLIWDW